MIYCSRDKLIVGAIEQLELSDDNGEWHILPVAIIREASKEEYEAQWQLGMPEINTEWEYYYEVSID